MKSSDELDHLVAKRIAQSYLENWMYITNSDSVNVYFLDETNSPIIEGFGVDRIDFLYDIPSTLIR